MPLKGTQCPGSSPAAHSERPGGFLDTQTDCPDARPPLVPLVPQINKLREEYHLDLRVLGIASSSKMLLSDNGVDLGAWREEFDSQASAAPHWPGGPSLPPAPAPGSAVCPCSAPEFRWDR